MNEIKDLKSEFNILSSILGGDFKEVNLNKSASKTVYLQNVPDYAINGSESDYDKYQKTGVKSDFIKLFKIKLDKKNHYSLGFAFNSLKTEFASMNFSLKISDSSGQENSFSSGEMLFKVAKEKLKNVNRLLQVNVDKPSNSVILDVICQNFLNKNLNNLSELKVKKLKL